MIEKMPMCFSINLNIEKSALEKSYHAKFSASYGYTPFYFASAFENPMVPVIANRDSSLIVPMVWGLIPHWVTTPEQANLIRSKTYNARIETIHEKPSFRYAARSNRCIIPVTGFFEWQEVNGKKVSWLIKPRADATFSIAGLWNSWTNVETGELIDTFTIITQPANELMSQIHNTKKRMPAIVDKDLVKSWLDAKLPTLEYDAILRPLDSEFMDAHVVPSPLRRPKSQ